jgi:hypothetical protein
VQVFKCLEFHQEVNFSHELIMSRTPIHRCLHFDKDFLNRRSFPHPSPKLALMIPLPSGWGWL